MTHSVTELLTATKIRSELLFKSGCYLFGLSMDVGALRQQDGSSACVTIVCCNMQGGVALQQAGCRMCWLLTLAGGVGSEWYLGKGTDSSCNAAW